MTKFRKSILSACAVLAMALMVNVTASAKEVTVPSGGDIQATINQVSEGTAVTIKLEKDGVYTVSNTNGLQIRDKNIIEGNGATINFAGNGLLVSLGSDITIDGVKLVSKGTAQWGITIDKPGVTIKNCTLEGFGIFVNSTEKTVLEGNTIKNAVRTGIRATKIKELTVKNNTITDPAKYGIHMITDNGSVIEGNTISGAAGKGDATEHGEGLVVDGGTGTVIQKNTINNTKSTKTDNGNAIIVANSKDIKVTENTISVAGNHGIQVSYASTGVVLTDNKVSGAGNAGISISRGASVSITGDKVTDCKQVGIALDGDGARVTVAVKGVTVNNTATGRNLFITAATTTVDDSTFYDTAAVGSELDVLVRNGSNATLRGNTIGSKDVRTVNPAVGAYGSSALIFNNNTIINNNYQYGAMVVSENASITAEKGNTIKITGAAKELMNITNAGGTTNITSTKFSVNESTATSTTIQNYLAEVEMGVYVNGKKYTGSAAANGGTASFTYPQADTTKIAYYMIDRQDNTLIINSDAMGDAGNSQPAGGDNEQLTAFVERMYTVALGRKSDAAGLKDWVSKLANKERDGAGIAQGFLMSKEFLGKGLDNEAYVDVLYKTFFDRAGDEAGKKYWMDKLASGTTRQFVLAGFVNSKEFTTLCEKFGIVRGTFAGGAEKGDATESFVLRLYSKVLERNGDANGVKDWVSRIKNKVQTPEEVAKGFFGSKEFINKGLSNEAYVDVLYQTFMDRAADAAGKADWVSKLKAGTDRTAVLEGFSRSKEFKKIMESFGL